MSEPEQDNKVLNGILAGAAAAGVIGLGVLYTQTGDDTPPDDSPPIEEVLYVDDIEPIRVPIVAVSPVKISPLNISTTSLVIPPLHVEDEFIVTPSIVQVETYEIEQIDHSEYIETLASLNIDIDRFEELIQLNPQLISIIGPVKDNVPTYAIIYDMMSEHLSQYLTIENINVIAQTAKIFTNVVGRLDDDVLRMQELKQLALLKIQDKRMVDTDPNISIYNKDIYTWMDIYDNHKQPNNTFIPLPNNIKMIAELRTITYAKHNLTIYREIYDYNSCLITINGTETSDEILTLIDVVIDAGLDPWIAWSGPESLKWTIFRDPVKIANLLTAAAPFCKGYLVGWRRTSAHLVIQDPEYLEYLVSIVRKANPNICILGESYYGETSLDRPTSKTPWEARSNAPHNQSGILLSGMGTYGYSIENMVRTTFNKWRNVPKLGLVLGAMHGYGERSGTSDFFSNIKPKEDLRQRFLNSGCVGTITLHGDGSDKGFSISSTDDIGKFKIQ